jgi:hypothetical protein
MLAVAFAIAFTAAGFSSATNVFVTQSGIATGNCPSGAAGAPNLTPAQFNLPSNWGAGAGKIGPGTTVLLCGTLSNSIPGAIELQAQGSGTSGSPITILFDTNANITNSAYWNILGAINLGSYKYITVNGGKNGIIQNTGNGSSLQYQKPSTGIRTYGTGVTIENLTIANLYVHSSPTDTAVSQTQVNCVAFGGGSNVTIANNKMHDAGWCLFEDFQNGDGNVSIYNNTIYNVDHGWMLASQVAGGSSGPFNFYGNQVYGYANWDTTNNTYHHDGIHCFTSQTGGVAAHITSLNIYNNLFTGPVGVNITAHMYLEGGSGPNSTACADVNSQINIYNNILTADNYIYNGLIGMFSGNGSVYNNTIIGSTTSQGICFYAKGSVSALQFKNNAITNCNMLVAILDNIPFTPDYNAYGNGGGNAFVINGSFLSPSSFSKWKSLAGGDSHSTYSASLQLSSSGVPQSESPVTRAGTNLTSLGVTSLDSDTSAGNTRTPVPRPAVGPWDAGAYEGIGPNPPSGLTGIVK